MSWPDAPFIPGGTTFELQVEPRLCGGIEERSLFGGWTLAAFADAAQAASGRHLRSLSAAFIERIPDGALLTVSTTAQRTGGQMSLLRVEATTGDTLVATGQAWVGPRAGTAQATSAAPVVPPPDECEPRSYAGVLTRGLTALMDVRVAGVERGSADEPRTQLWARLTSGLSFECAVAMVSDHVPYLAMRVMPHVRTTPTLDASVRIVGEAAADWLLLDVRLDADDGGYAVGRVSIWDADGRPVAEAQQTMRLVLRA